jgi:hypothetical protein
VFADDRFHHLSATKPGVASATIRVSAGDGL